MLGVYTVASVDALTEVASNNDIGILKYASRAGFEAVAGRPYYVAGRTVGQQGPPHTRLDASRRRPAAAATPPTTGSLLHTAY